MNIKGEELTGPKKKIFCAALELFSQNGFIETGIREIATAVGLKESSLYSHFESKGDILDYIIEYYTGFAGHRPASERGLADLLTKDSGADELISLITVHFPKDEAEYYFQSMKVMFQEAGRNSTVRKFFADHNFIRVQQSAELLLGRLVELGALREDTDIKLWATLHIGTIFNSMGRHALGVGEDTPRYEGKGMIELIRTLYETMFGLYGTKRRG